MLMRQREVLEELGISRPTLLRWRKTGKFPEPILLSPKVLAWKRSDVMGWIEAQPHGVGVGRVTAG